LKWTNWNKNTQKEGGKQKEKFLIYIPMKKTLKAAPKKVVAKKIPAKRFVTPKAPVEPVLPLVPEKKFTTAKLPSDVSTKRNPLSAWFGGLVGIGIALYPMFMPLDYFSKQYFFFAGAVVLLFTAILSKERIFIILETILLISASLGFVNFVPQTYIYAILTLPIGIALGHLFTAKYFVNDHWAFLGLFGFMSLCLAFAVGSTYSPLMYNLLLAGGSMFIAMYSFIRFAFHGVWIALIWFVLNVAFCVTPVLSVIASR